MNYRYDTSMMPQADLLRVCLSCWKRIPSQFSRQILHHQYPATSAITCNGKCGQRWTRYSVVFFLSNLSFSEKKS